MYGVDVAVPVSAAQFTCLMAANVTWASVRAWHSTGSVDQNAAGNLAAAATAGLKNVDAYLFPCRALSAEFQASATVHSLPAGSYGAIWLDIEMNPSRTHATHQNCSWATHDAPSNCEYVRMLADAIRAHNVEVGILILEPSLVAAHRGRQLHGDARPASVVSALRSNISRVRRLRRPPLWRMDPPTMEAVHGQGWH